MNDDILTQTFLEMQKSLGSIDSKMQTLCEVIKDHSIRIQKLESKDTSADDSFKTKMLEFMAKAVVSLIAIVGSLTGAGALLKQIFCN